MAQELYYEKGILPQQRQYQGQGGNLLPSRAQLRSEAQAQRWEYVQNQARAVDQAQAEAQARGEYVKPLFKIPPPPAQGQAQAQRRTSRGRKLPTKPSETGALPETDLDDTEVSEVEGVTYV